MLFSNTEILGNTWGKGNFQTHDFDLLTTYTSQEIEAKQLDERLGSLSAMELEVALITIKDSEPSTGDTVAIY